MKAVKTSKKESEKLCFQLIFSFELEKSNEKTLISVKMHKLIFNVLQCRLEQLHFV